MSKAQLFKSWCAERMGHPMGVEMGRDAVKELEIENEKLKDKNEMLLKVAIKLNDAEHAKGGSLGVDGQFYYKVGEDVFNDAEKALKR